MTVHSVVIELMTPDETRSSPGSYLVRMNSRHTFQLGHGQCGREVTKLEVFTDGACLEVEQWCEDNPENPDYFGYPWHQVKRFRVYHTDNPNPAKNKQ